ncbi:MAG: hypothetical protein ACRDFB_10995 [Rhabdochlamydiaceae bacterium]
MKKSKIIYIGIISSSTIGATLFFLYYYDFVPSTKENAFGIHALVVHTPPFMGGCDNPPCQQPDYVLKLNSKKHVFLTGYNICKGIFCVRQDGLSVPLGEAYVMTPIIRYIPWKVGDTVNIRVKVSHSYNMAGSYIPNPLNMSFVDLGNSTVIVD